jgi:predicted permease
MCIPLLQALLGPDGVFYGSVYIAVFNMWQWTYGVMLMTGRREDVNIRQVLFNPGTIGLALGLAFFLTGFRLPDLLATATAHLTNLNTPLAMLVIGGQLATVPLPSIVKDRAIWRASILRLLAVPLLLLCFLYLIHPDATLLLACLVPASAPIAAAAALFATRYGQDEGLASRLVACPLCSQF